MNYQKIKQLDANRRLGKRVLSFLLTEDNREKLSAYFRKRSRKKLLVRACEQKISYADDLVRTCLQHIVPVTAPLALILRIEYSGGSFLNRLFDGHPELYTHPHELMAGSPFNDLDPEMTITDHPRTYFKNLFEAGILEHINQQNTDVGDDGVRPLFIFLPYLQEQIFIKYLKSKKHIKTADLFEAYLTSYFGAWLNYRNLGPTKKFITALAPKLSMQEKNMDAFFTFYPEGRLIYVIRDPLKWFLSASGKDPQIAGDAGRAMTLWKQSIHTLISNRKEVGSQVCLIRSEDLVAKTKAVMTYLANFLEIKYDDILLTPTFNSEPAEAVSFLDPLMDEGHKRDDPHKLNWDKDNLKIIEKVAVEQYQRVVKDAVKF
jgi:hypothetical protein